jgi:transposase
MIQVSPRDKIFIAIKPVDFRIGIDSAVMILKSLKADPFAGAFFVFINKRKSAIKLLAYDGQGMWLMHKRLSEGKFTWWPQSVDELTEIDPKNFIILLFNGDSKTLLAQENWKKL